MALFIIVVLFLMLAIASWRWGVDSTDGLMSPEWERRQLHAFERLAREEISCRVRETAQTFRKSGSPLVLSRAIPARVP